MTHLSTEQLSAGLDHIRRAPKDEGMLEMIVRRPAVGARQAVAEGRLDADEGLVGDTWRSRDGDGGGPDPEVQLTIMNARAIALVAQAKDRWPLAGDQLFIDIDLSEANMPPGTRLAIGTAVVEVTSPPHTGCRKFVARFGLDAMKFVNSKVGRELHLRGVNARVVQGGTIRVGDLARKQ